MVIVMADELRQAGMDDAEIAPYEAAVKVAWAEFVAERPDWRGKMMTLNLGTNGLPSIRVTVGMNPVFARAQGRSPAELGTALLTELRGLGAPP